MIEIDKCEESTSFSKICQLQSQIHQELLQRSHIFNQFDDQRQTLKLKNQKTISI